MLDWIPEPWVTFVGRFHPLMVHLPIGFLLVVVLLELVGKVKRLASLASPNRLLLGLTVLAAAGTAAAGYFLSLGGGYNTELVSWHMWTGFAVAGGCALAFALHLLNWRGLYHLALLGTLGVLVPASHFGGTLTHGTGYLTEAMPAPLRTVLGLGEGTAPGGPATTVANPMQANAYQTLIRPVLNQHCVDCHGPAKSKGGLRLDSLKRIKAGGDDGPVLTPGKPDESPLVQNMLLPLGDDHHMPPEGNPQPDEADIALISWWVANGAEADRTVGQMTLPGPVASAVQQRLGGGPKQVKMKPLDELAPVMEQVRQQLKLVVQPIAQDTRELRVSARNATDTFDDADLNQLKPLAANIRWLDLASTDVTDDGLKVVGQMPNLTRLQLQKTSVTDAGLKHLTGLWSLRYLNLHSTNVTDAGLTHLKRIPRLKQAYLWDTNVTAKAAQQLEAAFDSETQVKQWQRQIASLKQQIQALNRRIANQGLDVKVGLGAPGGRPETGPRTLSLGGEDVPVVPINETCPVQDKPVDPAKTVLHRGRVVGFCCDQCPGKYQRNPQQYVGSVAGFHDIKGQYVRIDLPGEERPLHLAEVQVISDGKNIATAGTATQSSTDYEAPAKRAIDGNTNGNFDKGSVTHTKESPPRWWQVDLGNAKPIDRITVHNRTDEDLHDRLDGFRLSILNADKKVIYTRVFTTAPEKARTVELTDPSAGGESKVAGGQGAGEASGS